MNTPPVPIQGSSTRDVPISRQGSWTKDSFGPSSGGWTPQGMEGISSVGSFSFTGQGAQPNGFFAPSGSWRGEGWRGLPVPPSSPSNLNPILSTSMTFSSVTSPFGPGSFLPSSPAYSSRDLAMSVDSDQSSLPSRAHHELGAMYAQHGVTVNQAGQLGRAPGSFGGSSFVGPGSVERLSQLEQNFTSNFNCCGLQLKGLHDLLNHYELDHVLLKETGLFQKQAVPRNLPSASLPVASQLSLSTPPQNYPLPHLSSTPSPTTDSDAPHTPGMMDLEMDDAPLPSPFPNASLASRISSSAPSPWSSSSSFIPQGAHIQRQDCLPPSLLYSLPPRPVSPVPTTVPVQAVGAAPERKASAGPAKPLSPGAEEKKAKKKREKKEKAEGDEGDGEGGAGEKRFRCPVEGCGKVYKQQNGLKYHLQRSINSSHGHLAGTVTPQGIVIPPPPMVAT